MKELHRKLILITLVCLFNMSLGFLLGDSLLRWLYNNPEQFNIILLCRLLTTLFTGFATCLMLLIAVVIINENKSL